MKSEGEKTQTFRALHEGKDAIPAILNEVYEALKEKGYNPVNQLVGYLLSGDPTYVTSHRNARTLIRRLERDEILEELVRSYLERDR